MKREKRNEKTNYLYSQNEGGETEGRKYETEQKKERKERQKKRSIGRQGAKL